LGAQECQDPVISDVQFRCADNTCTHMAGRCNGVSNCADGSDEEGCATTTTGLTLEAMTGFTATIETPAVGSAIFYDRTYTFDSLGSFTGHSFVKMSNEDKHIRHSHVQMKLRLPHPMTLYVAQLDGSELPWLQAGGWSLTNLDGVSYHGVRQTRHTDWSGELTEDHYGPGRVWAKTFTAGAVEMQGNNGGMGSYVIFAAHPANAPVPPEPEAPTNGEAEYIGCFQDDGARDMGAMRGNTHNPASNTFALCRATCGAARYMALQFGGECFCADDYSTPADQYPLLDDAACHGGPTSLCQDNSYSCGSSWTQAIYEINSQCTGNYEAEEATLHGAIVHADSTTAPHQGFTGSSFVDYLNPNNDYIEWSLPSCAAGSATLSFRYALGVGNRPLSVLLNGAMVTASLDFPATGAWSTYGTVSLTVALEAGNNVVKLLAAGASGANVDSLIVSA
jgi:hypothetical protein